jgi:hypothetical protein
VAAHVDVAGVCAWILCVGSVALSKDGCVNHGLRNKSALS